MHKQWRHDGVGGGPDLKIEVFISVRDKIDIIFSIHGNRGYLKSVTEFGLFRTS